MTPCQVLQLAPEGDLADAVEVEQRRCQRTVAVLPFEQDAAERRHADAAGDEDDGRVALVLPGEVAFERVRDDAVAGALQATGMRCGDAMWRMPLWRPYRKLLDGQCADLNNVAPTPFAGSIIGALYLAEFVSRAKAWVHVDLFASNAKARPGRPEGGEATGLRTLYEYIRARFA